MLIYFFPLSCIHACVNVARYSKWAITQIASPPDYAFGVRNVRDPGAEDSWGRELTINYSSVIKVYFDMPRDEISRSVNTSPFLFNCGSPHSCTIVFLE
jgi:hypothetical protein